MYYICLCVLKSRHVKTLKIETTNIHRLVIFFFRHLCTRKDSPKFPHLLPGRCGRSGLRLQGLGRPARSKLEQPGELQATSDTSAFPWFEVSNISNMVKGCERSVICLFGLRSVNQMNSAMMASSMTTKVVRAWAWLTHEARASCYRKQVNTTQAMLKRWEGDFTWFYKQFWSFLGIMLHVHGVRHHRSPWMAWNCCVPDPTAAVWHSA